MSLLTALDKWLASGWRKSADEPVQTVVVQYGSTKSYTFRREALRGSFMLPEVSDQDTFVQILRATQQFYLPDFSDEDFDNLQQMLVMLDDVILQGLKDPFNWVLPAGFADIPFVKARLDKNYPIDLLLSVLLQATRLYVWLHKADAGVSELTPHLLELEEAFESLRTRVQSVESSNRASGRCEVKA